MMEAASTSETPVKFSQTTWCSHLQEVVVAHLQMCHVLLVRGHLLYCSVGCLYKLWYTPSILHILLELSHCDEHHCIFCRPGTLNEILHDNCFGMSNVVAFLYGIVLTKFF
jgi:hypothetical protein